MNPLKSFLRETQNTQTAEARKALAKQAETQKAKRAIDKALRKREKEREHRYVKPVRRR